MIDWAEGLGGGPRGWVVNVAWTLTDPLLCWTRSLSRCASNMPPPPPPAAAAAADNALVVCPMLLQALIQSHGAQQVQDALCAMMRDQQVGSRSWVVGSSTCRKSHALINCFFFVAALLAPCCMSTTSPRRHRGRSTNHRTRAEMLLPGAWFLSVVAFTQARIANAPTRARATNGGGRARWRQ
jgi:hypothetical protein